MQTPKELALEKRVFQWYKQNNYPKIIKAVERLNPKTRSTAMDALLAHSYTMTSHGWQDRKQNLKAVTLIKNLEKEFKSTKDEFYPMLWLADAYWALERYNNALQYYLRAKDLAKNPGELKKINERIFQADHRRILTLFTENFKERVEKTWKEFEKRESEFRNIFDKDIEDKRSGELNKKLQSVLDIALEGNTATIDRSFGKHLIVFSNFLKAYANPMLIFEAQYLKDHCPNTVRQNWEIKIGKPPLDLDEEEKVLFNQIQIWIQKAPSGLYSLEVFPVEKLEKIIKRSFRNSDMLRLLAILTVVVGEIGLAKFVTISKILEEPLYDPYLLLPDLAGYLTHHGLDIYAKTETLLDQEICYDRKLPNDWNKKAFRDDVVIGRSKCVKLLLDFEKGNEAFISNLEGEGIAIGSLYFKHSEFKGENKEESIHKYKEEIKKFFFDFVGEDGLEYFGEAHGEIYEYIDVVIWDSRKFFQACLKFTELDSKPLVSFHPFFKTAPALNFNKQEGKADLEKMGEAVDLIKEISQHVSL
ncbi:MAG: hypothetical protein LUC43_04385 [Burkholderiales bacterium]|nr:hypothetical protein [Burkholderiales bacterium]